MANYDWDKFFEGCCANDFKNFKDELVWFYEYQPDNEEVRKHGYVHVSHKQYFNTTATDELPEFKPACVALETSAGIAPFVLDPKGEQFVLRFPDIRKDPGREAWRSASDDKKGGGWNRDKVFADVLKTAKQDDFPAHNVDQWHALRDMTCKYETSDSLPTLPISIRAPADVAQTTESFDIDGVPIAWGELWSVLDMRFPRPNLMQLDAGIEHDSRKRSVVHDNDIRAKPSLKKQKVTKETLAAHNNVTSMTNPPAKRARAVKVANREKMLSRLPTAVDKVAKDTLYFVRSGEFEGELKVGLAMALQDAKRGDDVSVMWFTRKEWTTRRTHKWADNPLFIVAGEQMPSHNHYTLTTTTQIAATTAGDPTNNKDVFKTVENISTFCPVPVNLTKQSSTKAPKLLKSCVLALRMWCSEERLVNEEPAGVIKNGEHVVEDEEDGEGEEESESEEESEDEVGEMDGEGEEGEGEEGEEGEEDGARDVATSVDGDVGEDCARRRPRRAVLPFFCCVCKRSQEFLYCAPDSVDGVAPTLRCFACKTPRWVSISRADFIRSTKH